MKKIIFLINIICAFSINAQKLETVHSIVRERREISWYELQQKLWKAEVDKNNLNGEAWYNYYKATRALAYLYGNQESNVVKSESNQTKNQELRDKIVEDAYKIIPNSFEANLMKDENRDMTDFKSEIKYLMKAYEINPNDPRTFDGLMIYNEIMQNKPEFEKFAVKMFEYNVLSAAILNWGYNILSELDENAILFTAGDNDTYACWIVQEAKKFRKDVQIINSYMIMDDDFRNKLFKNLNIPELKIICKNAKTQEEIQKNLNVIVQHLINSNKSIYTSTSTIQSFEAQWNDQLYLTGLAYKYSKTAIDNTSIIRRNYEKRYLLDHLKQTFSYNIGDKISYEFNSMYLPSMLKLYKNYEESEELYKMEELKKLIISISEKTGQLSEVMEVLNAKN